ncbi:hypothetical protein DPQ33_08200 [Oceanidesulfovibrio indonesiensis]|uniref:Uncharacterized protein n=1 Tax=Oceanidesulfovibrio indonesiensis TaxID=54767 RepID=A0A7M3MF32_9BACT|nr:hypothetical protein [Oceanidesulfovibrio indonesiensis]TVM17615.1 hypothetical protein DPQ33_08200 [Oceanidesulfovibrio indonesiensis]
MEKVLIKLARQLNAYDEASLMSLWETYAARVQHFEPTKRWEEAVLVFGFLQAMRWKNQLFNYHWAQSARPGKNAPLPPLHDVENDPFRELAGKLEENSGEGSAVPGNETGKRAKVLHFRPREDDESV